MEPCGKSKSLVAMTISGCITGFGLAGIVEGFAEDPGFPGGRGSAMIIEVREQGSNVAYMKMEKRLTGSLEITTEWLTDRSF